MLPNVLRLSRAHVHWDESSSQQSNTDQQMSFRNR